jgi:catechol 2,3-dioxygenase-like lactoylglutathione lyase family enzyme
MTDISTTDISTTDISTTDISNDVQGVLVAMLPVSDLARSAAFYRDLLGLRYRREFSRGGVVTGCALGAPGDAYALSLRRRDTTPGRADLRDEHPLIFRVPDRAALDRVYAHAERLGFAPTRGEHPDAAYVEVRDPDGICTRFGVAKRAWDAFDGVRIAADGTVGTYPDPLLPI